MKTIADFDALSLPVPAPHATGLASKACKTPCTKHASDRVDSLEGLLSQESLESFRKFRDSLLQRLQASADKELSVSVDCPSNTSELFSVYKGLESEAKSWDLDKMLDQKGQPIDFVDLFIHRYKQVCKDRQRVRESDLRQFSRALEEQTGKRRRPAGITNFDCIFQF